jgi:hypothetical protein
MTPRARVEAAIAGRPVDRIPFVGRLELWHRGLVRQGRLPEEFADMDLNAIHRAVGFGRQQFLSPYLTRLRGVEIIVTRAGEVRHHERNPLVERFPDTDQFVESDQPGVTTTCFRTPVGDLIVEHTVNAQIIADGVRSYMSKHPILGGDDYAPAQYILEHMEIVPQFARHAARQADFGEGGFVIPSMERIPFQQLLIDYFVTTDFFYALHDSPRAILRLLELLDEKVSEAIRLMADLPSPYLQIGDNLDGDMTNPRLFRQYCLPAYQRYTDAIHAQGKRAGSHTDGNLKSLLDLLAESGLDVCESFSPAPLTPVTVAQALEHWPVRPIIWGGIPSPLLEARTPLPVLEEYIQGLLATVGTRPILLNVVDMVLYNDDIERIRHIARWIEAAA